MESQVPSPTVSRALLVPLAAVLLILILRSAWVTDDAYITLRTVDNFVRGHGLGWNAGERVQAYTHPLWMALLTIMYAITRQAFLGTIALGVMCTCGALLLLARLGPDPAHGLYAFGLLALSRAFVEFSTSGLENPLSHLLIAAFVLAYAVRGARLVTLSLLASLLALNRMDTLLVALPALAHVGLRELRDRGLLGTARALALGFFPFLAWELFSLVYYGFLVPNTAYAKLNTGIPSSEQLAQGGVYALVSIAWDPVLLASLVIGAGAAWFSRDLRTRLVALGGLFYLVYVLRVGGDFMAGRFLTVPLFTAACLVALTPFAEKSGLTLAGSLGPCALLWFHPVSLEEWPVTEYKRTGIADERQVYREQGSLMLTSRLVLPPRGGHVDEGIRLRRDQKTVELLWAMGYVGFFAGPSVHVVDHWALGDALLARLPMRYDPEWRVGHYTRTVPDGYIDTLRDGTCRIPDPQLCKYVEALHTAIRGPIWSWQRLRTIARFQIGAYDGLIDPQRYRFPKLVRVELAALSARVEADAGWDGPGMRVLEADGIELDLGKVQRPVAVSMRLDADEYYIAFRRNGRTLATVTSPAVALGRRWIRVPPEAKDGFDHLHIWPHRGDGRYAVGHVRLEWR
jgi:arabinofuranosyltransferase